MVVFMEEKTSWNGRCLEALLAEFFSQELEGGFPSAPYFRLQAANTYLNNFSPFGFTLIDLTAYNRLEANRYHLRDELNDKLPKAYPFSYCGEVFLFLQKNRNLMNFAH